MALCYQIIYVIYHFSHLQLLLNLLKSKSAHQWLIIYMYNVIKTLIYPPVHFAVAKRQVSSFMQIFTQEI